MRKGELITSLSLPLCVQVPVVCLIPHTSLVRCLNFEQCTPCPCTAGPKLFETAVHISLTKAHKIMQNVVEQ